MNSLVLLSELVHKRQCSLKNMTKQSKFKAYLDIGNVKVSVFPHFYRDWLKSSDSELSIDFANSC